MNKEKEEGYETLADVSEKITAQQMMVHTAMVDHAKLEYSRIGETAKFNNNALREALEPKYEVKDPINLADIPPEEYKVKEDDILLPVKDAEKILMDEEEMDRVKNEERVAQEQLKQEDRDKQMELRRAQRAYHRQYIYCFGELTEQMITCKFPPSQELHELSKMKW